MGRNYYVGLKSQNCKKLNNCQNFEIEISHYAFKKNAAGKELPQPEKEWDHLMDAMRYAMKDDTAGVEFVNTSEDNTSKPTNNREEYERKLRRMMAIRR